MSNSETFEGWAILELMGHRRLAGKLSEQEIAGAGFIRIDIPGPVQDGDEQWVTQFYAPSAVYAITPTVEDVARELAKQSEAPVSRWELRALLPEPEPVRTYAGVADDDFSDHPF